MKNKTRTLSIFGMILLVITQLILINYMVFGSPVSSLTYIDLNNWTRAGSEGNWEVISGGREVTQKINGEPTFFVNDEEVINVVITGTMSVDVSAGDDDMIGFVLGYQEPAAGQYEFILFDWKKKAQTYTDNKAKEFYNKTSKAGFTLAKVAGDNSEEEYNSLLGSYSKYLWFHEEEPGRFEILKTKYGSSEGWSFDTEYQFKILYTENRIKITIDNEVIFDVFDEEGTFEAGRIGFYNNSQAQVTYGRVKSAPGSSTPAAPIAKPDRFGMVKNTTLNVNRYEGLLANDYDPNLDSFTITKVANESHGTLNLQQNGAFTYTPVSDYTGTDSFTYYLTDEEDNESDTVTVDIVILSEINAAPKNITLTGNTVEMDYSANGTEVGTLHTTDPNAEDSHDYMLIDNADGRFRVVEDKVIVNDSTKLSIGMYNITVRSTDLLGLYYDKTIPITVQDTYRSLTYTTGEHGSISGSTHQNIPLGGDGTPVIAIPADGYCFDRWSDGVLTVERTHAGVTEDINVTAYFINKVPDVTTEAADNISSVGATLNGVVNANNSNTTVTFEYGINTYYGTVVTAAQSPVSGTDNTAVNAVITGLTPGTTYHYRVNGGNEWGPASGTDKTFTTLHLTTTPTAMVTTNNGTIKKDAVITLSSEPGATIYYTTALNSETPATPTASTPTFVPEGGTITYPALANGDVLKIKAIAVAPGKAESNVTSLSYTVQPTTELQLSGIILYDKEYDGNTDAPADFSGACLTGVIGTDSVALEGTPSASYLTSEAESDKTVTVSGYSLSGVDAEYYTLNTTLTETTNITKKALTLGAISIEDKTYDGEKAAVISSIPIENGIVGSEDVSVDISLAVATYDTGADAGTNKDVTVSHIQLTGADSGHYSVPSTAAATGDIVPRTVSVENITIKSKVYDANTVAVIESAILTGKVGMDDVTIDFTSTPATAFFEDSAVGNNKQVMVEGLQLGGSDKANYVLDSSSFITTGDIIVLGTVTTPEASVADGTTIKNGTAVMLTTPDNAAATLYYSIGLAPDDPTPLNESITSGGTVTITGNLGETIIVKVYGTQEGYIDSPLAVFQYIIQPRSMLTVTGASAADKVYDGTNTAAITGGALEGAIVPGDDVSLVTTDVFGEFTDKSAGTDKTVTVGGYALTGADAMYYGLIQPTLTADIQKKDIGVTGIVIDDKVYDNTLTAEIISVSLEGKVSGDDVYVHIPSATAVFSDVNIGINKAVSVTGLELAGTDCQNYQLINSTVLAIGNIIPTGTVVAPSINPLEDNILAGTSILLSASTDGATIHYTMDGSMPTSASSVYSGPISITGNPGERITIRAVAVKAGMLDSSVATKQYTIVAPGSFQIMAVPGNQEITISWDAIPNTVSYSVYNGDLYLGEGISVVDSVYGYHAIGLTNGNQYTFTVNALGYDRIVTHSAQTTSVPRTVPATPTHVTATAGDRNAIIHFNAPDDDGGSEIIGFVVTSNPGGITTYGINSPITVNELTNGTSYTFTVKAINAAGESVESEPSNAVTPQKPADESDYDPTPTPTPTPTLTPTPTPPPKQEESPVEVLVNGKTETAATSTTTRIDDKTITTVTVDDQKIEDKLKQEGIRSVVTIPFTNDTDFAIGELNGQTIKNMETMDAVLEIQTGNVTYTLPASEINIDAVSEELGSPTELKDIKTRVSIAAPAADTVSIVEDSANKNAYQIVVKPIEFEITCTRGDKTVSVSKFNSFVERTIAIPDDIDPGKITTAIVLNPDGTFSHIPTTITIINGRYYAQVNSLTNSTYSVIYNPKFFNDVDNHWAKEDINDMGSRLIMHGYQDGSFDPDSAITRDEFAAVVVRALGLMRPGTGRDVFTDVTKEASNYDAVSIAYEYGIISGYGNNIFGSMDKITREQAITMIVKAMKLTGLEVGITQIELENLLEWFTDSQQSAEWAKESLAAGIKTEIVYGKSERTLAPKDELTRSEAAALVRRFLQKSGLI